MLLLESHLTNKYATIHAACKAHGETHILIINRIKTTATRILQLFIFMIHQQE